MNPYEGTHLATWIKISADPHAKFRGFSIINRELKVLGYDPVEDVMVDLRGETMRGRFWVVEAKEVYRVIPEMKRFTIETKPWFFPVEFCSAFFRPIYYQDKKVIDIKLE